MVSLNPSSNNGEPTNLTPITQKEIEDIHEMIIKNDSEVSEDMKEVLVGLIVQDTLESMNKINLSTMDESEQD